jgi:predicted permease
MALNFLILCALLYLIRAMFLHHKENRKRLERLANMYGIETKNKSSRVIRNRLEALLTKHETKSEAVMKNRENDK